MATRRALSRARHGRRAERKADIRRRIVEAALALFRTRGFEQTTTRAIARRARIAEGTVFNYFPTKDDIALEFFHQEVAHAIAAVRADRRLARAPLDEQLFALIQHQLEYLAPHERFIGAAFVRALNPGSGLNPINLKSRAIQTDYLLFVRELFERSAASGAIAPLGWWTPEIYWIYYMGVLLFWLNDPSPGKQSTLAFLDRSLKFGVALLRNPNGPRHARSRRRGQ
jgi:AcrR family transcriptional regulator